MNWFLNPETSVIYYNLNDEVWPGKIMKLGKCLHGDRREVVELLIKYGIPAEKANELEGNFCLMEYLPMNERTPRAEKAEEIVPTKQKLSTYLIAKHLQKRMKSA
jgi:hypothetical protein